MLCLRVNGLEREWGIDLPELISIQLGYKSFKFCSNESSELVMRSGDKEVNEWIDLPKLSILTAVEHSGTFKYPRSITLESVSYHSIFINRYSLPHHCRSWPVLLLQIQEDSLHKKIILHLSLIYRYHSRSWNLSIVISLLHVFVILQAARNPQHLDKPKSDSRLSHSGFLYVFVIACHYSSNNHGLKILPWAWEKSAQILSNPS